MIETKNMFYAICDGKDCYETLIGKGGEDLFDSLENIEEALLYRNWLKKGSLIFCCPTCKLS